jgi:hypothetical protein
VLIEVIFDTIKNKMMRYNKVGLLLAVIVILVGACRKDPFNVNVSGIETHISITRFEEILFSADPATIEQSIPQWKNEFGIFFRHYCYIVKLGNIDDPDFPERLRAFVTDHDNYQVYIRTREVFPDLTGLTTELNDAFKHYLYYFPGKTVPKVFTYVSGFNQSAITDDSLLAIGLDKYLGNDEALYRQMGVYNYLMVNMHPKKIVSDCMGFWGETEFPYNDSVNSLITNMIYRGRLLYFISALLPDQPDTLKWGFTQENLDYFMSSEKSMWAYLIENKLLFKTDRFTIDKFILEGPFTKDFGRGSPARACVWIGYRMVQSYMAKNSGINLSELMMEKDYMKILNQGAYNP